jgi:mRNA-degrading endonuclease YafQ of YafQ-DinJ toxin-antitoxin module
MEEYKYGVRLTNQFKKDFNTMKKRKEFSSKDFEFVVDTLRKGKLLPEKYKNHLLEPKSERNLGMPY